MRRLADKTRVQAPDSIYPFGQIRDQTPTALGTPVNEELYGDIHQLMEKMVSEAGLAGNGLPDNEYNGFELYQALKKLIDNRETSINDGNRSVNGSGGVNLTNINCQYSAVRIGDEITIDISVQCENTSTIQGFLFSLDSIADEFKIQSVANGSTGSFFLYHVAAAEARTGSSRADGPNIRVQSDGVIHISIPNDFLISTTGTMNISARVFGKALNQRT